MKMDGQCYYLSSEANLFRFYIVLVCLYPPQECSLEWGGMLELEEQVVNVPEHGKMDTALCVIPFEHDANVAGAGPICGDFVVFL